MTDDACDDARPADDGAHAGLFESFPDPVLAYAGGDRRAASGDPPVVSRVNPAFEARFAVDRGEIAGTPLDEVELVGGVVDEGDGDASDRDAPTGDAAGSGRDATVASLLERLGRDDGTPVRLRHGSGSGARHFRVRAVGADDGDAHAEGDAGTLAFVDVTDLERERRDLAGAVARLERLASVARHDLRNPLEVASIRLEAARDTGEDVHFEKVAGALERIERIVRDVLVVGGDAVAPTDAVALDAVAEAAWTTVDTADATLVVEAGLPTVRGDPDRLRQLFENLFRNAVEHGADGGRSAAGGDCPTVTVTPGPDGFVVADDGPGFPREARERGLEPGYSTEAGNSGLGLSIVDGIARGHGWRVSLAPEAGSGDDGGARIEFTGVEPVEGRADGEHGADGGVPPDPDGERGPD
jgi:signal transduction histidine kinase